MAPAKSTASPTPGPSATKAKDLRAMAVALYNWCRVNYDEEHILSQKDLLEGAIIPNKDLGILIQVTQSLINERLFRTHDLRSGGIGWKIVSHVSAEKYKDLSPDESLVYSVIESAGISGAWVKTIKGKLNLHQKNVDQSIKALIQRGYIKSMSTVKFPNRKMYILAGLQPGEDATGGAWFTDGVLDLELVEGLANTLEKRISQLSWEPVIDVLEDSSASRLDSSRKRKEPRDGFGSAGKGKEKMRRSATGDVNENIPIFINSETEVVGGSDSKRPKKTYVPYPAGYQKYATRRDLTNYVNDNNFVQSGKIPENNISQLLNIMEYDDRIIKVKPLPDESCDTMYKARRNLGQINADDHLADQIRDKALDEATRMSLFRKFEVKKLGNGGMTEVPCGRCPVFDMCEVGGPVNPNNCEYFEEWFTNLESQRHVYEDDLTW